MRHRVYGRTLGRDKNERTALFKNLVHSLLTYGTIETTEAKAKSIKGLVDKIINLAKSKNSQRLLASYLVSKPIRERLISEVAPKLSGRNSGYTSLVKLGRRLGDNSMIVRMSLIGQEKLGEVKKIKTEEKLPAKEETKTPLKKQAVKTIGRGAKAAKK
ncbi:50S ribosomal protein L17 [Candidatus Daviesbacteria bacterium]|nr:50S ribosomal protein L17 [Candidatus Daviesbacteria bacterium]